VIDAGSLAAGAGTTTSTSGSGFSPRAASAASRPVCSRNVCSPASAGISSTAAIRASSVSRARSASAAPGASPVFRYNDNSARKFQPDVIAVAFCTNTASAIGSARATPTTAIVISDSTGVRDSRPSVPTSVWAWRNNHACTRPGQPRR
jgi:hypothetical protein